MTATLGFPLPTSQSLSDSILTELPLTDLSTNIFSALAVIANMGASEWIAFISMLAACTAAGAAIHVSRSSARMYSLSLKEQQRTEPAVEVYLADSRIRRLPNNQCRVYVFRLLISNKSLNTNSITKLTLSFEYGRVEQPRSNLILPHDPNMARLLGVDSAEILRVPRPIASGEAISGVATFPIANALLSDESVESYTVTITDAYDREAQCHAILLRETRT